MLLWKGALQALIREPGFLAPISKTRACSSKFESLWKGRVLM